MNAVIRFMVWGTMPIGALLGGAVAEVFGLQAVFILAAVTTLGLVLLRPLISEQAIREAEARAIPDASAQPA